jgi:hypothetical protein
VIVGQIVTSGGSEILAGVTTWDLSPNTGLTPEQLGRICAGVDAAGESSGTLTLTALDPCDGVGMAALTNLLARLWTIVRAWAIITSQPVFAVNGDGTWKMTIATNGAATTYQWQERVLEGEHQEGPGMVWNDVGGATSATFNNPPVNLITTFQDGQQTVYRCVVTRGGKSSNSEPCADLATVIGVQPVGGAISAGSALAMTATIPPQDATGATYQWYKGGVAIGGASGAVAVDTASYSVASAVVGDAGDYTVVITLPNGVKVTSDTATWTVN